MSGGTRSFEMARRFVAQGHEVHMVTSWREPCDERSWFQSTVAGINIHWLPVEYSNHMSFTDRIKAFFDFALKSSRKAFEIKADLVFATSTPLTIALPGIYAARRQKIPMVFEVRDLWPELPIAIGALKNPVLRFGARMLENWAYKNSSAIVTLSTGMKEGVVSTGYPSENIAVIPNSSDNVEFAHNAVAAQQFRRAKEWLGDKPLLVYTGTFGKINGVDYMVHIASALLARESDVRILLVGSGAERRNVMEAAKEAGVYERNLFFEKSLPKKNIPGLLSAANMAVALFIDLPEMRTNSANKFFDALASSTPVLLNYGGWMHDLVMSHRCGLPAWQKSVDEVAEDLDNKLHDQLWLEKAGYAARKLAEMYFDRDDLANQLITVLKKVVEGDSEKVAAIAPGNYS
jgi:glycosyltransferase involved in cell wall biosynthesis